MVHIRDFVDFLARVADPAGAPESAKLSGLNGVDLTTPLSLARILRPVLFAPPSMPALDLLVKMQSTRTHMALVIDEYGGTDGLASIEDIVEMIVGDIEDEHDEDDSPRIDVQIDGTWLVDARASLQDLGEALAFDFIAMSGEEKVETLGGLVTTLAGRVLARGDTYEAEGLLRFDVLDADRRRLKRIRITLLSQPVSAQDK
jgi:CBS domain containing-hemolysin-like protein